MKKHPQLAEKLKLLYSLRLNPEINSNADLAKRLGISRQAISKWVRGTETRQGNEIPFDQLEKLAELFGIETYWFALELTDYVRRVRATADQNAALRDSVPERVSLSLMPVTHTPIFGREKELEILLEAWRDRQTNLVEIVAFGGAGKSALVNAWLSTMARKNYLGAHLVYAWSFYWQGGGTDVRSSGDYFIEHALKWFGDENPTYGTPWAKATRLADLIRSSKCILILDGLEPLQNPPGPKIGTIENPAVSLLLKELTTINPGLCIVTTRLAVSDLTPFHDGRVKTIELRNLEVSAGTSLLNNLGVIGPDDEFAKAVKAYDGHPLSLSLLAGYLIVVLDGKIERFRQIGSLFDEPECSAHIRNLMQMYLDWFSGKPECDLLYLFGLQDRAASIEELKLLAGSDKLRNHLNELGNTNSVRWNYALRNLEAANLVSVDRRSKYHSLDCHPLVRDFLADHLSNTNKEFWRIGHSIIFENLRNKPKVNPETLEDIELLFRAVIHGTQAGLYEEAFSLYFEKIKRGQFSAPVKSSHLADQACLRSFLSEDLAELRSPLPEDAKYFLFACSAANLICLGQVGEAEGLAMTSIDWYLNNQRWIEAALAAAPLASMFMATGHLGKAFALIDSMQDCISRTKNILMKAMASNFLAYALFLNGQDEKAREIFETADKILLNQLPETPIAFPTVSSFYCKFLLDTGEPLNALSRCVTTFAWRDRSSWQVSIDTTSLQASDMMVLALIFLELGDLINSKLFLDKQIELLKHADEWLYLPTGLNYRAKYFITTREFDLAINDLEAALDISLRTGAFFEQWETYLNFAKIYVEKNDFETSLQYLNKALGLPGMHMYKFRDAEIAIMKNTLNTALTGQYSNK